MSKIGIIGLTSRVMDVSMYEMFQSVSHAYCRTCDDCMHICRNTRMVYDNNDWLLDN